jgi:molecular chaperone GrpE
MADDRERTIPVSGDENRRENPDAKEDIHVEESFSEDLDPEAAARREEELKLQDQIMAGVSEVELLRAKLAEAEDQRLRMIADFDNYRRRTAKQFDELTRSANDKLILEMLEIADNFDRALKHAGEAADVDALRKGMELIQNQIFSLLAKYDIRPLATVGTPFDPNKHEALMQVATTSYPEGIVAMEISKGFMQGDRVVRYAKVGVSTGSDDKGQKIT